MDKVISQGERTDLPGGTTCRIERIAQPRDDRKSHRDGQSNYADEGPLFYGLSGGNLPESGVLSLSCGIIGTQRPSAERSGLALMDYFRSEVLAVFTKASDTVTADEYAVTIRVLQLKKL